MFPVPAGPWGDIQRCFCFAWPFHYLRRIFGPMFTAPITHIPGICHFIGFLTLEIHPPERTMGPLDTPCWGTFGEFQPIPNLVIGGSTSHCARKYMNYRSNVRIHNPPKTNCNPFRLGLHSNLWWKKITRSLGMLIPCRGGAVSTASSGTAGLSASGAGHQSWLHIE